MDRPSTFFKRQHVGKNKISAIVRSVCELEEVKGVGKKEYATMHSLRGSMALILLESGHNDAAIIKRTGHAAVETLRKYLHLQGFEGIRMQGSLMGRKQTVDEAEDLDVGVIEHAAVVDAKPAVVSHPSVIVPQVQVTTDAKPQMNPLVIAPSSSVGGYHSVGAISATTVNVNFMCADPAMMMQAAGFIQAQKPPAAPDS